MQKLYISFWLPKAKKNNKNLCPIYCRMILNKDRKEKSTGIWIEEKEWNQKKQKIVSTKNAHQMQILEKIKRDLEIKFISLLNIYKFVTLDLLAKEETNKSKTLKEVYESFLQKKTEINQHTTANRNRKLYFKILFKFLNTTGNENILVHDFKAKMTYDFLHYLKTVTLSNKNASKKQGYANGMINKIIGQLKCVLDFAVQNEIIPSNPIAGFQFLKVEKKKIIFLESEEIEKLKTYKFASQRLQQVADIFVFQCYTGFAYNELKTFDEKKDTKDWKGTIFIYKDRGKTGTESLLPFFPQAREIYNKYEKTLPIISNQKYNAYIKEVAEIVGITKNLTTHVARKTAAMLFYEEGATEQIVAKMLGHSTAKTTFNFYASVREGTINKVFTKNI